MIYLYDCSYNFDNPLERKKYKYIVITKGNLDINNAMMLRTISDVKAYIKEQIENMNLDEIYCIVKVESFEEK